MPGRLLGLLLNPGPERSLAHLASQITLSPRRKQARPGNLSSEAKG